MILRYLIQGATRRLTTTWLQNSFWWAMLLVHLPGMFTRGYALLASDLTDAQTPGFIALNLSSLFFVLKVAQVRWLAFNSDRRSLVALTVAIVLLHAGIVPDGQPITTEISQHVLASVLFAASLTSVQTALSRLAFTPHSARLPHGIAWRSYALRARIVQRYLSPIHIPRAPPRA